MDEQTLPKVDNYTALYAVMMEQLLAHPSFQDYLATHYDVNFVVDDADEMIDVQVRAVSLEETQQRVMHAAKQAQGSVIAPDPEIFTG